MSNVPFVDGSPAAAPYFVALGVGTIGFLLCVWVGLVIRRKLAEGNLATMTGHGKQRSLFGRKTSKGVSIPDVDDILGPLTWVPDAPAVPLSAGVTV
jgi:hypothetical protein